MPFVLVTALTFIINLTSLNTFAESRKVYSMGTEFLVHSDQMTHGELGVFVNKVYEVENRLSSWKEGSWTTRSNRELQIRVTPEEIHDIKEVQKCVGLSEKAFHPGLGNLIKKKSNSIAPADGFSLINEGLEKVVLVRNKNFIWDLGGIGKGVALKEMKSMFDEGQKVSINFGGQLLFNYNRSLLVASPLNRNEPVLELRLFPGSVATSSNRDGENHIYNGQKLVDNWGSITVYHTDPVVVDCLSTALYALGFKDAKELLQKIELKDLAYIFIVNHKDNLRAHISCQLMNKVRSLTDIKLTSSC